MKKPKEELAIGDLVFPTVKIAGGPQAPGGGGELSQCEAVVF